MSRPYLLLVEDDPNDAELVQLAIAEHSLEVDLVVASSGVEALDILKRDSGSGRLPVLILLDLNLPKLSGIETLTQLRSQSATAHVPIVIFSSSEEEKDIRASYKAGANGFVQKPVDFSEFSLTVRNIGQFWLGVNRFLA